MEIGCLELVVRNLDNFFLEGATKQRLTTLEETSPIILSSSNNFRHYTFPSLCKAAVAAALKDIMPVQLFLQQLSY